MTNIEHDELGLKDRVVLVTGAGRGLGRAYALLLGRCGAKVVVHDAGVDEDGLNPDPSCAGDVAETIRAAGGDALAVTRVLSDAESCREVVASAVAHYGRVDALVHSAGLVERCDPTEIDEDLFRRVAGVNSDAAFWLCSRILPVMRDRGFGRIVLTTSGWAHEPSAGSDQLVLYAGGKGAQLGLAMALAKGAGQGDIKTNLISPVANTRMFKGEVAPDRLRPELVAGAVAWLASPACSLCGCLVKAVDGTLCLARIVSGESAALGEKAVDPGEAGRALLRLAAAESAGS